MDITENEVTIDVTKCHFYIGINQSKQCHATEEQKQTDRLTIYVLDGRL